MLAGLDARQLGEIYEFAELEPLDAPLQRMLARLTSTLAQVHGNDLSADDFMLVPKPVAPAATQADQRSQQIYELFSAASRRNERY